MVLEEQLWREGHQQIEVWGSRHLGSSGVSIEEAAHIPVQNRKRNREGSSQGLGTDPM